MATADVIAEVAYARFLREFDYNIVWPRVSMDVSAELSEYGDSISFPTDDSDPAVTDITLANLQGDVDRIEETFAADHLNLMLATSYVRSLLRNAQITRYIDTYHRNLLEEFRNICEATAPTAEAAE